MHGRGEDHVREEGKTTENNQKNNATGKFTFQYNFQVSSFSDRSTLNTVAYH